MPRDKPRLLAAVPVAVALLAYANSLPGDFVFDDVPLVKEAEELRDFELRRIFLENYWGAERADRNYRPLLLLSYAANHRLGAEAWKFHAVNWLLNGALALLVYLVLREILGNPGVAALGASLYTVLPVHVEAVTNIVGRAEILAALAILGAWLVFLRSQELVRSTHRAWVPAALVGALTFLGLASKENAVVVPAVILTSCWLLRRRIPWGTLSASILAVLAYLALRAVVLAGKENVIALIDNPLRHVDALTRALNAIRLLGYYAWKIVVPIHLSADYSYDQIPVLGLDAPELWISALGVIAAGGLSVFLARRRLPAAALGVLFFFVAIAPISNIFFPIGTIFAERLAFTPSLGYPLALCALALAPPFRRAARPVAVALISLVVLYAARTVTRNADWATAGTMYARMSRDAPRSARSHQKEAEGYVNAWLKQRDRPDAAELVEKAKAALTRSRQIYPEHGMCEATLGEIYLREGKYAEAAAQFTKAEEILSRNRSMQPPILRFRAECNLRLGKHHEALADVNRYIAVLAHTGARPDFQGHLFRGLALVFLGSMKDALKDFDVAVALRPDLPETRNNRAMCRFHLGDFVGAIDDWNVALARVREAPGGDIEVSPARLLAKLADAHARSATALRAAGDEASAQRADAEAARLRAEAERAAGPGS